MCQKDSSNLTHTVCFDVLIDRPIGEPDVTNKQITHLLKLDIFFHTHDARIMTHNASQIRTRHRVDLALKEDQILVPFYNEYATVTRVQHRTSRDYRNQSEHIVVKKLQQEQIYLKLLPVASYLSSLLSLSPRQN